MAIREQPLVSILTPVYNGASYLAECIESILNQTYQNFEYVIVNNCSTDDTLAIARQYASRDKRVRVHINDSLLDIISNHNRAFKLISPLSKYCKVVSADDLLFPECITKMVSIAESNPSVGIVGSYQVSGGGENWRGWRVRWDELPFPNTVISGREVCRVQLLGGPYVFGTPTSLLYRSSLVRKYDEFYPNAEAEADTSACYQCLHESDFGFVHQVLSYERIHERQMSEECRTLNSYEPSRLSDLLNYGPKYLTADEVEEKREEVLRTYYRYLAKRVLHRTDRTFWTYHKRRLTECGQPLSAVRLASAVLGELADLLLNPKQTVEKIVKHSAA